MPDSNPRKGIVMCSCKEYAGVFADRGTFLPAQSLSHTPSYPEQRKQISVNRKKNSNIRYKETTAQTNDVKKT